MTELIAVGGYPGAGKTTLLARLQQGSGDIKIVADDFMKGANKASNGLEASPNWQPLLRDLQDEKRCVIADVQFVRRDRQKELRKKLGQLFDDLKITWRIFENAPEKARMNVRSRGRKSVERELELIEQLRDLYHVPESVAPEPIRVSAD